MVIALSTESFWLRAHKPFWIKSCPGSNSWQVSEKRLARLLSIDEAHKVVEDDGILPTTGPNLLERTLKARIDLAMESATNGATKQARSDETPDSR